MVGENLCDLSKTKGYLKTRTRVKTVRKSCLSDTLLIFIKGPRVSDLSAYLDCIKYSLISGLLMGDTRNSLESSSRTFLFDH